MFDRDVVIRHRQRSAIRVRPSPKTHPTNEL